MNSREAEWQDRMQAWMGTAMMVLASGFAILIFCDRTDMPLFRMPAVWYSSRGVHLVVCGAMFLMAAVLLKSPGAPRDDRHGQPLFHTCRLYTRSECPLCEDAMLVLIRYQDVLPGIDVIDIDTDPQLIRQFGESVPVVEIDGRVRFRGAVSEPLLKRLIHAAELREEHSVPTEELLRTDA